MAPASEGPAEREMFDRFLIRKYNEKTRSICFGFFAVRTGLEPATPGVTGRYSNQLNYRTIVQTLCVFVERGCKGTHFFYISKLFVIFLQKKWQWPELLWPLPGVQNLKTVFSGWAFDRYFTSITRLSSSAFAFCIFGSSISSTPFSTVALMPSFSTLSGRINV